MGDKLLIPPLEVHLTHSCNLTCHGCNHYSNYKLPGWFITPQELESWIQLWADRLEPASFNLLGGEPTLHPKLCELLLVAAKYFKKGRPDRLGHGSPICLITNGSFLHRHPGLKEILLANRIRLFLSVHYDRQEDVIDTVADWGREGVAVTLYDYAVQMVWRKFYQGHGREMEPFEDNHPRASWEKCSARGYFQLYQGKIWKCANIAYLSLAREALQISGKWDKYLAYQPLEAIATPEEVAEYFGREEESICNMCPSNPMIVENTCDE